MRPFWVVKIYNEIMVETNIVWWTKHFRKSKNWVIRREKVTEAQLTGDWTERRLSVWMGEVSVPAPSSLVRLLPPLAFCSAPAGLTSSHSPPGDALQTWLTSLGPKRSLNERSRPRGDSTREGRVHCPAPAGSQRRRVRAALQFGFSRETGTLELYAASQFF